MRHSFMSQKNLDRDYIIGVEVRKKKLRKVSKVLVQYKTLQSSKMSRMIRAMLLTKRTGKCSLQKCSDSTRQNKICTILVNLVSLNYAILIRASYRETYIELNTSAGPRSIEVTQEEAHVLCDILGHVRVLEVDPGQE